jgi:hypothetical protein
MNEQKRERLWHRSDYRSGLQPSAHSAASFLGRCPRLVYPAPSALSAHSSSAAPTARPIPASEVTSYTAAAPCAATANHGVPAPTARPIPAWGGSPCFRSGNARELKARSIPAVSGLKARFIPAWGAAPCKPANNVRGLKARPIALHQMVSCLTKNPLLEIPEDE